MKHIIRHFKVILSAMFIILGLTGCSRAPTEEQLLNSIPKMDVSTFNRFLFTMDITANNTDGNGETFSMSGAVETYGSISHMYNLDISFEKSGYQAKAETWANFSTNERYTDLSKGFTMDKIANSHAIDDLADVINNRDTGMILTNTGSVCTLSWTFPTDNNYLFGDILKPYTADTDLKGYGRIMAVFDPKTYKFQYFTFVISASNEERAGALLDAVFCWDVVNSHTDVLEIPNKIICTAYKASTGVSTDGRYDPAVNPIAESFMAAYGGTAEINHYDDGAHMFWTLAGDDTSAAVNYMRTDNSDSLYEESYSFFKSFYGSSVEETDNGAYFYDSSVGDLTYIAKGDDWYAEIIITGGPGITQGNLRKPLITYKAKLGI